MFPTWLNWVVLIGFVSSVGYKVIGIIRLSSRYPMGIPEIVRVRFERNAFILTTLLLLLVLAAFVFQHSTLHFN